MAKGRPLSERHNVITELGYLPYLGDWKLYRARSYWVMTVITVITVNTLITYIGGKLFWKGIALKTEQENP